MLPVPLAKTDVLAAACLMRLRNDVSEESTTAAKTRPAGKLGKSRGVSSGNAVSSRRTTARRGEYRDDALAALLEERRKIQVHLVMAIACESEYRRGREALLEAARRGGDARTCAWIDSMRNRTNDAVQHYTRLFAAAESKIAVYERRRLESESSTPTPSTPVSPSDSR